VEEEGGDPSNWDGERGLWEEPTGSLFTKREGEKLAREGIHLARSLGRGEERAAPMAGDRKVKENAVRDFISFKGTDPAAKGNRAKRSYNEKGLRGQEIRGCGQTITRSACENPQKMGQRSTSFYRGFTLKGGTMRGWERK